ncbi:trans-2-enoyl-CoA reductase family protein [Coxiella endosymbiont of Amblyomma sculptum]|uniref:enoyl-ACP reductase FabV n=1 Tax=Coxiella endosymbiont of Amblyomma sculptum TaxID=2487929 RepID=UPI00132E802B|nr:enoyl-ACP reductase FabV [Coxiella endosymbiont of Amblyomma sculptum]QHG92461.1 trans-2-enoyl-CoA reductase family protein [Coxiella endosymbiont of Amblyomma sculptum]
MIIAPKIRGFVCTTAHPEGCKNHVMEWIDCVRQRTCFWGVSKPKKVLIIGSSSGFGLASRVVSSFGIGAETIGVFLEKRSTKKRTASPGWYNAAAFEKAAHKSGLYAKSINGDAFSDAIKEQTIRLIQQDWKDGVDLVVYSIASPRRVHPKTGEMFSAVLKPIKQLYRSKTIDVMTGEISEVTIEPATEKEIQDTIAVMGGDDWTLWITSLLENGCLSKEIKTIAFTYIGPEFTHPIYRNGTIGRAKLSLEATARRLHALLQSKLGGQAVISVNKALVTQASVAIPVVPLYISLLYKVMKEKNLHEDCIEQMWRLFRECLYGKNTTFLDTERRVRIDDREMRNDVQSEVQMLWKSVNSKNVNRISDISGYRKDFYKLFGFGLSNVDYEQDVDVDVDIPSIQF